jgi:hypothetical protein
MRDDTLMQDHQRRVMALRQENDRLKAETGTTVGAEQPMYRILTERKNVDLVKGFG